MVFSLKVILNISLMAETILSNVFAYDRSESWVTSEIAVNFDSPCIVHNICMCMYLKIPYVLVKLISDLIL